MLSIVCRRYCFISALLLCPLCFNTSLQHLESLLKHLHQLVLKHIEPSVSVCLYICVFGGCTNVDIFDCRLWMSVHKRTDTSVTQSSAYTPLLYVASANGTLKDSLLFL